MVSLYSPGLKSLFLSSLLPTSWFHLLHLILETDCPLLGKEGWVFVVCFYSTLWNGDGISRDFWSTDNDSDRLRYGGSVNQQRVVHIPSARSPSLHHELLPGFQQIEQRGVETAQGQQWRQLPGAAHCCKGAGGEWKTGIKNRMQPCSLGTLENFSIRWQRQAVYPDCISHASQSSATHTWSPALHCPSPDIDNLGQTPSFGLLGIGGGDPLILVL